MPFPSKLLIIFTIVSIGTSLSIARHLVIGKLIDKFDPQPADNGNTAWNQQ